MRYVLLRDDDTNASTPVECLEQLYRPFLDRGFPVNLAVIPDVATNASTPEGAPEGFIRRNRQETGTIPIGRNRSLVDYLLANPGYHVLQHGCHHDCFEFAREDRQEISQRIARGRRLLVDAGFRRPETFVAPHDRLSRVGFEEVARVFGVLSTGWFELRRLPRSWWPPYLVKRFSGRPHWRVGNTVLLSHPGCLLSCQHPAGGILERIVATLPQRRVTVLVTHWWEYFREGRPDTAFISALHETAEYLSNQTGIRVISFDELREGAIPLN